MTVIAILLILLNIYLMIWEDADGGVDYYENETIYNN